MLWRAPFWQQFLILWVTTALLVAALLSIDRALGGPAKFFWLIPYPTSVRTTLVALRSFFGNQPLLASAIAVPVIALVLTTALAALHLVRLVIRAS